jgi:hypothetical protein
MKTFTHLWLDDKGLKAFNAPSDFGIRQVGKCDCSVCQRTRDMYHQSLQQAIKQGRYFKPDGIPIEYKSELMVWMKKGEVRPIPDGYEVRVEEDVRHPLYGSKLPECEYAILVPKEKVQLCNCVAHTECDCIYNSLDASQFKGNERINHFLVNALRQLTADEIRILGESLIVRGSKPKQQEMSNAKQKTAMQEVILKMQDAKENFPAFGFHPKFVRGFDKAFQMAILITEEVGLLKERQQIIDFHVACVDHGAIEEGESVTEQDKEWIKNHAEQYYNETYGSHD